MKKILCPIDFSQASLNGLHYAYELAHFLDVELILIHTLSNGNSWDLEETAKERLENICRHLSKSRNKKEINYHFLVKEGDLFSNVLDIIANKNIDMVIMGTKGTEDSSLPYGSFSSEMIAKISCPLLIVPHRIDFSLIKNIVYATDLKEDESVLVKFVNALAKHTQAHITYVTISGLPVNGTDLNEVKLSKGKNSSFHRIEGADTLEEINSFAEIHHADLIVMSTSQQKQLDNLIPSNTRKMIFKTKTPLLIMHKEG